MYMNYSHVFELFYMATSACIHGTKNSQWGSYFRGICRVNIQAVLLVTLTSVAANRREINKLTTEDTFYYGILDNQKRLGSIERNFLQWNPQLDSWNFLFCSCTMQVYTNEIPNSQIEEVLVLIQHRYSYCYVNALGWKGRFSQMHSYQLLLP